MRNRQSLHKMRYQHMIAPVTRLTIGPEKAHYDFMRGPLRKCLPKGVLKLAEPIVFRPHNELSKEGLRVDRNIDTRGKHISITFEAPAQINNTKSYIYSDLKIGMYSFMRHGTLRHVETIGRYCSIGPNVTIGEEEHPTNWLSTSPAQYSDVQFKWFPPELDAAKRRLIERNLENSDEAKGNVKIGNDVWIGGGATIRRGVRIGDGAIIAGHSYVTRDVEPYSIVSGLPAKHVRYRFSESVISQLKELRWFEFDINDLAGIPFERIESAISDIRSRENGGHIMRCMRKFRRVKIHTRGWYDLED
jgi:acetyltransferase-like isoleucine patch superfamily enzyme